MKNLCFSPLLLNTFSKSPKLHTQIIELPFSFSKCFTGPIRKLVNVLEWGRLRQPLFLKNHYQRKVLYVPVNGVVPFSNSVPRAAFPPDSASSFYHLLSIFFVFCRAVSTFQVSVSWSSNSTLLVFLSLAHHAGPSNEITIVFLGLGPLWTSYYRNFPCRCQCFFNKFVSVYGFLRRERYSHPSLGTDTIAMMNRRRRLLRRSKPERHTVPALQQLNTASCS